MLARSLKQPRVRSRFDEVERLGTHGLGRGEDCYRAAGELLDEAAVGDRQENAVLNVAAHANSSQSPIRFGAIRGRP